MENTNNRTKLTEEFYSILSEIDEDNIISSMGKAITALNNIEIKLNQDFKNKVVAHQEAIYVNASFK